jgi:anaerobic magnesium-protoporphyrin IX monomethyl ester cyclase
MNDPLTVVLLVFHKYNQGPVILYEELVQKGCSCKFVYYLNDDQTNRFALVKFIRSVKAALIGFSFASLDVDLAFELSSHLSRELPNTPIIFGGIHPTIDPIPCLDHCTAICVGEGDKVILEILEKMKTGQDYLNSHNLAYKKNGQIIFNALNPLISDLDSLPHRRLYTDDHVIIEKGSVVSIDAKKYIQILPDREYDYPQIFSRGCPYSCSYCCNSGFSKLYLDWPKVRSKSVAAIIREVCTIIESHPKIFRIFISDDCFLHHDIDWLSDFVKEWRQKVNIPVCLFSIPAYITREKLEVLKKIDVCYFSIGLQSGSKRINALYNRRFSKEAFLQACSLLRSFNINLSIDLLLDNPWEEETDYLETLDILTHIKKPFLIHQFSLKIYPGTKLYEDCRERNMEIQDFNKSFKAYTRIQRTDINRIVILTQILPRKVIMFLFKNRNLNGVKMITGLLYLFGCIFIIPLGIFVIGPKKIGQKILLAASFRKVGWAWIRTLLGFDEKNR